jgi:hypothetical protein
MPQTLSITAGVFPADRRGAAMGVWGAVPTGLLAWAVALIWIVTAADVGSGRRAVAFPLFLAGLGAGCTFAPMATEVMRNVAARLSGAASGVNNALRQVGSVLAGAVVGAVLQAQLANALPDQARQRAGQLPAAYRDGFVAAFSKAESDVNARQSAGAASGLPHDVADRMRELGGQVFGRGFVDAMGPAILVSAFGVLTGVLACLALRRHRGHSANPHALPVYEPELEEVTS